MLIIAFGDNGVVGSRVVVATRNEAAVTGIWNLGSGPLMADNYSSPSLKREKEVRVM